MRLLISLYIHVFLFVQRVLDYIYPRIYRHMPGLTLHGKVRFWGKPIIDIRNGGRIEIGEGSRLFSTNFGTHVNIGAPVKLVADKPGARIAIGRNCAFGGACIHAYDSISIGDNCVLGANTNIFDALGHPVSLLPDQRRSDHVDESKPVVIEDDVWIALNCVILPGTRIGARVVVAPNSVVSGRIPPDSIAAGNPARVMSRKE